MWNVANGSVWATAPTIIIPNRSFSNYPLAPRPRSRRLAKLDVMIAEFGRKFALARHESILYARRLVSERLWLARRLGPLLLSGEPREHQRRGRVCGESNYYRVMLC